MVLGAIILIFSIGRFEFMASFFHYSRTKRHFIWDRKVDACRQFEIGGKTYGHVLDPRSGTPSEGMTSVTVCAPDCTTADALSTAVFVAGTGLAEKLASENPALGFFLLENDPEAEPLVLGAMKNKLIAD